MKKKNTRVNINLTKEDHKVLTELKEKYRLSYSTICNILTNRIGLLINRDNYIFHDGTKASKTSIKPRNKVNAKLITNCVKLFTRKELKNYLLTNLKGSKDENLKVYEKLMNGIYDEFLNTYDPNWDGNKYQRLMPKLIKQNKEYYKKLLGVNE